MKFHSIFKLPRGHHHRSLIHQATEVLTIPPANDGCGQGIHGRRVAELQRGSHHAINSLSWNGDYLAIKVSGVTAYYSAILDWLPCSPAEAEQAPDRTQIPTLGFLACYYSKSSWIGNINDP